MGIASLAARIVRAGADLGAGLGTNLAAAAIEHGVGELAFACLGVSAVCIAAKTAIEAHGEENTQKRIEARLQKLLDGQNDLRAAINLLKADESVDEQRANALLNLLSSDDQAAVAMLESDHELATGLARADTWLKSWCERLGRSLDDLQQLLADHAETSRREHARIETKVDQLLDRVTTAVVSPTHSLPAPPLDFTGRESELVTLLDKIQSGGACITGLHGPPGVGKTAAALVLAHRVIDAYPDAQFFVDLRGTSESALSPSDAVKRVIQACQPETKLSDDLLELRPRYLSLLHGKKALILADNANGPEHVRPLIPPPGCLLLVTSRRHFKIEGLFDLRLDTLPEEDAIKLLLTICPRIAEGDVASAPRGRRRTSHTAPTTGHAAKIAQLCGYLPLALRAAASLLAVRPDIAVDTYVRDLADERTRLEKIGTEGVDLGVEASLNLSYRQLPPETARVFRLLSVFPATFDAAAEEQVCEDKDHAALGELLRISLAEFDAPTHRYRLHDLVRIFAARGLDEPVHAADRLPAELRHAEHYRALLDAANQQYLKGADEIQPGLALADAEWSNIQAGARWARSHADALPAAAKLASDYPDAGVHVLNLRLHPRQWADWLEAAVGAARKLGNRAAEGVHLGNWGVAHRELGEPRRAIQFFEQRLATARAIGDRRGESRALGNLGLAYHDLGAPRRAIDFYEQSLRISRAIGDRRGEGATLGNLGLAYAALGEPRRAIELCEQHLDITRAIGDRRGEGAALGNLGNAYAALGEPRRAIDFYEQDLEIARAIGDRRGEALASWNMGDEYAKLGDLPRAAELMQVCVDYERELGHPDAEKHAAGVAALRARVKQPARNSKSAPSRQPESVPIRAIRGPPPLNSLIPKSLIPYPTSALPPACFFAPPVYASQYDYAAFASAPSAPQTG